MPEELYNFDLVMFPETNSVEKKWSGSNHKGIMCVFKVSDSSDRATKVAFLEKIFAAVHCNLQEDSAIYDYESTEQPLPLARMIRLTDARKVFVFGFEAHELNFQLQVKLNHPFKWKNSEIVFSQGLDVLQTNQDFKKALWLALKHIFQI